MNREGEKKEETGSTTFYVFHLDGVFKILQKAESDKSTPRDMGESGNKKRPSLSKAKKALEVSAPRITGSY